MRSSVLYGLPRYRDVQRRAGDNAVLMKIEYVRMF